MICIYSPKTSSRFEYIVEILFNRILHVNFITTSDFVQFTNFVGPKINYSITYSNNFDSIRIPDEGLLWQTDISNLNIEIQGKGLETILFVNKNFEFYFDIFSASFYLITRYEEYVNQHDRDKWGRFEAKNSIAFQNDFLQYPIIHFWAKKLGQNIQNNYPEFQFKLPEFQFIPTFDIDTAFAFKNRSVSKQIVLISRDLLFLKFNNLINRILVLLSMKNDHYDTYQYIKDWCIQNQFSPKIFLQMGAYPNGFDKSIISQNQFFKTWAKSLNTWATIGIHPSVKASKEINTLQKEIKLFENLTGKSPEISRQHYLMLFMPDTYTNLIQLGIKEDNTMGYADSIGFRSSIAVKYPFFDLKINKISSLVVQPFAVMDGTLMQYMNLEKEEAYEKVAELISITQILGGDFVFLWHNNSFSDSFEWKGWKSVFEKMIAKAKN